MNHSYSAARLRSIALVVLAAGMLVLSIAGTAGAAPAAVPGAQTLPTATPAPPNPRPCIPRPPGPPPGAGQPVRGGVGPGIGNAIAHCPWSTIIGADVFVAGSTLELNHVGRNSVPGPNAGDTLIGIQVDINLFDSAGKLLPKPTFPRPIQICYAYSSDELALVGNDPARLVIQFYDTALAAWVVLPTTPDPAGGQICAQVTHLTLFTVAGKAGARPVPPAARPVAPVSLPNTAAAEPIVAPWLWALLALALGVGVALRLHQVQPTAQPVRVKAEDDQRPADG